MDFQIRQAITANVLNQSALEFTEIIDDAIARGEEHLLPGLGVFLEVWWQNSTQDERNAFAEKLEKQFTS